MTSIGPLAEACCGDGAHAVAEGCNHVGVVEKGEVGVSVFVNTRVHNLQVREEKVETLVIVKVSLVVTVAIDVFC